MLSPKSHIFWKKVFTRVITNNTTTTKHKGDSRISPIVALMLL